MEKRHSATGCLIKAQGVVHPIVVRETVAGDYELIPGERRWRAAKMAGLDHCRRWCAGSGEIALAVA
ncbi:MAG: hypothetical protein Ct9H300mP16_04380 [Pseudomonadota bacterium]|nr:MAG: hypothetical protein Ct9H300mP16_04380 [Pseudomonadota bacterium]